MSAAFGVVGEKRKKNGPLPKKKSRSSERSSDRAIERQAKNRLSDASLARNCGRLGDRCCLLCFRARETRFRSRVRVLGVRGRGGAWKRRRDFANQPNLPRFPSSRKSSAPSSLNPSTSPLSQPLAFSCSHPFFLNCNTTTGRPLLPHRRRGRENRPRHEGEAGTAGGPAAREENRLEELGDEARRPARGALRRRRPRRRFRCSEEGEACGPLCGRR